LNAVQKFLSIFSKLPNDSYESFIKLAQEKKFSKNDIVTKVGSVPSHFYIIEEGIIRSYYEDENGKEFTRSFFIKYQSAGALGALVSETPSKLNYDCLTDCLVYEINFKEFIALTKTDTSILNLYKEVLESIFLMIEHRVYELSILDAKARYLKFKKEFPDLENQINQYKIATYLNITPVQLSRIRKKLYS